MEVFKEFGVECAHRFASHPDYEQIHGHSYIIEIRASGPIDPAYGWVCDVAAIDAACADIRAALDHRYLNEIPGLECPTSESMAVWIWTRLWLRVPMLSRVTIRVPSQSYGCSYEGPE